MNPRASGLTLVEVLVAMSIAAIAGALLMVIVINSAGLSYKQSANVTTGLNINDALGQIRGSIKQANSVMASYTSGLTTYTSSSTQLVLKLPSIDSNGNVISNTFDYFVFFLDGNKLKFKSFPDTTAPSSRKPANQILALNVQSILIQYFNSASPPVEVAADSATKVRITLSLSQKAGAGFEKNTSTSEANLRND